MGNYQDDVYMLQYEKTGNEDPRSANKSGFTRSHLILIFQVNSHLKNLHVIDKTRGQCDQMRRFRAIWAIFRDHCALFFLCFIYCWALFGQNFYLVTAIFGPSLFNNWRFFAKLWAIFHSKHLVTLHEVQLFPHLAKFTSALGASRH